MKPDIGGRCGRCGFSTDPRRACSRNWHKAPKRVKEKQRTHVMDFNSKIYSAENV